MMTKNREASSLERPKKSSYSRFPPRRELLFQELKNHHAFTQLFDSSTAWKSLKSSWLLITIICYEKSIVPVPANPPMCAFSVRENLTIPTMANSNSDTWVGSERKEKSMRLLILLFLSTPRSLLCVVLFPLENVYSTDLIRKEQQFENISFRH